MRNREFTSKTTRRCLVNVWTRWSGSGAREHIDTAAWRALYIAT
jgi:hypothetical protein